MTRIAEEAAAILRDRQQLTSPGLTDEEIEAAERAFDFVFGEDHRALLRLGVPVGSPNWRDPSDPELLKRMEAPLFGALLDVDHNTFWPASWGARPDDPEDAQKIAAHHVASWPRMIPVHGHRYTAAGASTGAPVFSIVQTDAIFYGDDLVHWASIEFLGEKHSTSLAWDALLPWSAFAFGIDPAKY